MKYTESHEWIDLKGNQGTVGITSFAQGELGEVVSVELPRVGLKIKAGQQVCVLESTKAAADIYTPMSGTITEVNEGLKKDIGPINLKPETDGWLFRIEVDNKEEFDQLLDSAKYKALIS